MASIKSRQEMIDYCKQQMEHYLKATVAVNEMLANLGFESKINISLEEMND